MPKLTELERLFTSDSSAGRVKSAEKRKYHARPDSPHASTRSKSRKVADACSALLSVSAISRDDIMKSTSEEINNKKGNEEYKQSFVTVPNEYDIHDKDLVPEEINEQMYGNRIVDIQELDKTIRNNFCCRQCIDQSIKKYLQSFFEYADNQIVEMKRRGKKIDTLQKKVRYYEKETRSVSQLYQKYNGHLARQKDKQTRTDKIAVPVSIKCSRTVGLASELHFQCHS